MSATTKARVLLKTAICLALAAATWGIVVFLGEVLREANGGAEVVLPVFVFFVCFFWDPWPYPFNRL